MANTYFGIKGEPHKGVIFHDEEEDIILKYDPNDQIIRFYNDGAVYDHLDCAYFEDWESIVSELKNEYGIVI